MLQFDNLPVELVLKVLADLPQFSLMTIAQVCERWKELAFDPCLWTEVRINLRDMESQQQEREVLNRATLIRKLDVSGIIYIEDIASCSTHFKLLRGLVVPCRALSHRSVPVILRNCESLTTMALRGKDTLLPNDVRHLQSLKCLKVFSTSREARIEDGILRQHLKCLSVTRISPRGLLYVSKARPNLESLKIGSVWNENDVTVAQALQTFLKLRILSVDGECGTEWFDTRFRTPRELERFTVQQLHMEEHQINQLVQKCATAPKIKFEAISHSELCFGGCAVSETTNLLFPLHPKAPCFSELRQRCRSATVADGASIEALAPVLIPGSRSLAMPPGRPAHEWRQIGSLQDVATSQAGSRSVSRSLPGLI
ncbi:hypothetical protein HPB49_006897 [Dermacentor silvarum]|uniref:Uncharacterized protein n=1 Tax=Dermacentor silvarum TaxID=543639 RepID=A0ACB8DWW6_DERSI|nr:hypothetical protein HPB49_006897 [Dermacentor silvarum]